jgi:DNA polymerase (family 10)
MVRKGGKEMLLKEAEKRSAEIVEILKPNCTRILVVGSIRRKKPECNDIDILLIPSNFLTLHAEILRLGVCTADGPKLTRIFHARAPAAAGGPQAIQVDIYYATEETWGTLVLIRTGSMESNLRLCDLAKRRGWKIKASGEGLFDGTGKRIAGDSEEDIYSALGLKYLSPEQRV